MLRCSGAQDIAAIEYSPDGDFNWSMFKGKINPRHIAEMGDNTGRRDRFVIEL
jgi:hypothetical protein